MSLRNVFGHQTSLDGASLSEKKPFSADSEGLGRALFLEEKEKRPKRFNDAHQGAIPQASVSTNSQSQQDRTRGHQYSTSATIYSQPQRNDMYAVPARRSFWAQQADSLQIDGGREGTEENLPEGGIDSAFLLKHSKDQGLCAWTLYNCMMKKEYVKQLQASIEERKEIIFRNRERERKEELPKGDNHNVQVHTAHNVPEENHLQTACKVPEENHLQVDKLKITSKSSTKPTEERQPSTEENEQRNDTSSPWYSVKSFEEVPLSEQLRRGVYDMGFNKPSKIQERALHILLPDPPKNVIAQSQSGTGKTTVLVLSMFSRVDATKIVRQVICMSPTYELALQTGQVAEEMGKFCPEVKIAYALRGKKVPRGQKVTDHMIFGTPGMLQDWILRSQVLDPQNIKMFVLDDAAFMTAIQGHQDQCIRIYKTLPKDCQRVVFSETYDDEVIKFAETLVVPDPIIIRLCREEESLDNIKQYYVECGDKEAKFQALSNMYGVVSIGQCIVFCHSRESTSWLAGKMTADGHSVALLSGKITAEQRLAVLNRFREGKEKLLITTHVNARGINVEQVTLVINYDMPVKPTGKPDFETYLHGIGRTGRFGKSGIAVNFIDGQRSMRVVKEIEQHFCREISPLQTDDVDELEKLGNIK